MDINFSIKDDIFYTRFKDKLQKIEELKSNDKIIVAVSGGLDSVVLLNLLQATRDYKLYIIHINHKIRPESEREQLFVETLADEFKIPFYLKSLDPLTKKKNESLEEWGRTNRYLFFNEICKKNRAKWVMTAHHGNDQIETLLLNLSRRTGVAGLRGISRRNGIVLRPLIDFSRKEIFEFAKKMNINHINDNSNNDIRIPRNYLRKKVISPWEKNNKNIVNSISTSINNFKEWHEALDFLVLNFLIPKVKYAKNNFRIPISFLKPLPKILQIRLIQLLINNTKDNKFSKHDYKMLNQFLKNFKTGSIYPFSEIWELATERRYLIGYKKRHTDLFKESLISLNKSLIFGDYNYEITLDENKLFVSKDSISTHEMIDWSVIKNKEVKIRLWEKGDSFVPLGMVGHQKISDFLINEKIEQNKKKKQHVLTADNKIIWVCGMRISDLVKVKKTTKFKAFLIQRFLS